jgi:hypothetical protein
VAGDLAIVGNRTYDLLALKVEGAWGFPGSPAVGASLVFVTGLDGRVLAFEQ